MSAPTPSAEHVALADLEPCFGGAIPAVMATASADGIPNVTFISRAHQVDDDRIAISNQFMSKTARNIAVNPRASLLLMDPATHDEYLLALVYERTERRGHVFERLRADIDALATQIGMQDVFRLRAADIFRVVDIVAMPTRPDASLPTGSDGTRPDAPGLDGLADLVACIDRAGDLDVLLDTALEGLDRVLGYRHAHFMLLDEEGRRLYTIASHGFDDGGIGAEVTVGEGQIGMAAARCEPVRVGGLRQLAKYTRSVRQQYEHSGVPVGPEVPVPGLPDADSRLVVPAMSLGQLVGVLVVESRAAAAFGRVDEQALRVVTSVLANAVEHARALDLDEELAPREPAPPSRADTVEEPAAPTRTIRFFAVDGSTFLDGEYVIKGVAGRILWSLLRQHLADGRVDFTNKELRLDPSLEMPGFKDNLESRLILLKRRLDEREAPMRIEKTGRGRFRLHVRAPIRLDAATE